MSPKRRIGLGLLLATPLALVLAGPAAADSPGKSCERAVRERIQARNDGARDIDFERIGRDDDTLAGKGTWIRSNGERVSFRYNCQLDGNRVLDTRFVVTGESDRGRSDVAEMERECREAVRERMRREHPRTDDLELSNVPPKGQAWKTASGMKGRGEFVGNGGKHRKFTWSCNYDPKRDRVTDVDLSVDAED